MGSSTFLQNWNIFIIQLFKIIFVQAGIAEYSSIY